MNSLSLGPRLDPKTPKGLILPPRSEQPVVGRCKVVVNAAGAMCGATFYAGQEAAWERHVGDCARKHLDEIRAQAPSQRNKGTIFDNDGRDLEIERHLHRVGERMKREGRLEVLPSERAGFS